jgi:hypothetical protein
LVDGVFCFMGIPLGVCLLTRIMPAGLIRREISRGCGKGRI